MQKPSYMITKQESSAKLSKASGLAWYGGVLYLAPKKLARVQDSKGQVIDLCPFSSPGCVGTCLFLSGHSYFKDRKTGQLTESSQKCIRARILRTRIYYQDPDLFWSMVDTDMRSIQRKAERTGSRPYVRPNGTSDLESLGLEFSQRYPDFQVYDYTKDINRILQASGPAWPSNYHLTFSWSGLNGKDCQKAIDSGVNVAIPFLQKPFPESWLGYPVLDGDKNDLRFTDPAGGHVIGLLAKGRAKKDRTGFVIRPGVLAWPSI